jgi:hypothetical protein
MVMVAGSSRCSAPALSLTHTGTGSRTRRFATLCGFNLIPSSQHFRQGNCRMARLIAGTTAPAADSSAERYAPLESRHRTIPSAALSGMQSGKRKRHGLDLWLALKHCRPIWRGRSGKQHKRKRQRP